jgi:phage baseplate assembly protein W
MIEDAIGKDLKLRIRSAETCREGPSLVADLSVGDNGDIETISGNDNLGQAVLHRLLTRRGELSSLGMPLYGSRLHELTGEPNTERTRELARLYIKECISQEPRVKEISRLTVTTLGDDPSSLHIDMSIVPEGKGTQLKIDLPWQLEVRP